MKKFVPALLATALLTGGTGLAGARPALAQAASPVPTRAATTTLAGDIDAYIAQPQFARADWGIAVRSLDTGKVIYQHNADRLFVPASNAKLFTTALALATLGSNTRIATTLYATSIRVSARGVLRGNLILYGRGDPSLGLKDASPDWADRLAAALAERGVKRVEGNLIADATYFSGTPIGAGWEADDLQTWYGAVPSALTVQGNLIRVDVARDGRRCCNIDVTPDAAGVHVVNQTSETAPDPMGLYRPVGSSTLYAIGELPARARKHTYALSMPDPARAAGELLRQALARQGIELAGRIETLHWPQSDPALTQPGTQAIASIDSPNIAELVDHTLKNSDNLFAQTLLLQAGVTTAQRNACSDSVKPDTSVGWGLCALHGLLAQAGIPPSAVLLAEGSGLARRDLVTPNAFVQWLAWTATQLWGPDLRNALPVAGVDGTLEFRFRDGDATDNLQVNCPGYSRGHFV
ncbi:MAG: D-alanyl-D-alanine carboxypeptidase/D-alanyl-D-alanine endopeptidase [Rhodanobacteraceae bacterium]